jgi:hypothetical protein
LDRCPNTVAGAQVDAGGCPAADVVEAEWSDGTYAMQGFGAVRRGRTAYVTFVVTNRSRSNRHIRFAMRALSDHDADYLTDDLGNRYRVAGSSMSGASGGRASGNVDVRLLPGVPTRFQFVFQDIASEAAAVTLVLPDIDASWGRATTVRLGPMSLR